MYNSTRSDVRFRFGARPLAASFAGAALCLGCAGEVVDVGENGGGLVGDRCRESTTLEGDVVITSQEQLQELAGCEVIAGDLTIVRFLGADLSPLYALTRVEGDVVIGEDPGFDEELPSGRTFEEVVMRQELLAQIDRDWLYTLAGLERLEQVDSLEIVAPIANVEQLSSLRSIVEDRLMVVSDTLQDLDGLEQVRGVSLLTIETAVPCDISALHLPELMMALHLTGPITQLDAAEVASVEFLELRGIAVENLDSFQNLSWVRLVEISGSSSLQNIDRLDGLTHADGLSITDNSALTHLPSFSSLPGGGTGFTLVVANNSNLREIILASTDTLHLDLAEIHITDNPLLERVVMPGNWDDVLWMNVVGNGVREVDIGGIDAVGHLTIMNNPQLASWRAPALRTVNALGLSNNPLLPPSTFDGVLPQ